MENTSYGINVANRYDLFSIDDEAGDPFEALAKNKQKIAKKQTSENTSASKVPATSVTTTVTKNVKNAEKENKSNPTNSKFNNENRHPDKTASESKVMNAGNLHNVPRGGSEKHGIKETQKDNIRTTREDGKNGYAGGKNTERRSQINKSNFPSSLENREERNNRKNRELNNDENNINRKSQNGNNRRGGGNFEGRGGKREFDRQSGSNKTGVKAVEKREGTGSHNWGSAKADAKEYNNLQDDYHHTQDSEEDKTNILDQSKEDASTDPTANKTSVEEELKEMTLDEWKAQIAATRTKPQYNLRKAGEGEDATQWEKMVALDKKNADIEIKEENEIQKIGKQRQVLEIEFHFNDGRRGGLMGRSRGRGGKGGGRNIPKRDEIGVGSGGGNGTRGERKETTDGDRRNRPPTTNEGNNNFGGNYKVSKQTNRFNKNAAPKVDDEHDFPSLG
ncbi:plasminogen activator inhibitor 1 RNA-binding protein-like [Uranotaenia lowii]|uniref:plasminogen activator inhibitor 1 RNA-binding protein-like n=1 Tax=Uranotaenia lowii TaxID=190385 RepID=UPI00247AD79B|nr:plasminogen activator inhibitor 1 RNA-binding protein-like [Uranotaenia lowii]